MNVDKPYSSISRAMKREKLMALIERRKNGGRRVLKRDDTDSESCVKERMKWKKLNSHFYKKLFQTGARKVKVLNHVNNMVVKESCSGSRRKKQRLCSGQGSGESFHLSRADNKIESGSVELSDFQSEVSTETHDHVLPYVNKLREYRNKGQNAVFFDGQDRLVKVVFFVLSLLDSMKKPILIIASSRALSSWEIEFSKWSKSINVVTYKGNKDIRSAIRETEFYGENGCVKFQVLLSSPDAIEEDMELLDHIKWELLVRDECQRSVFSTHYKKLYMLMADMKLLTISGEPLMLMADMKLLTVSGESVDIFQSYRNILSMIDCKYEKINTVADIEKINTLKERLSPFIAFECKFNTPDFEEYWVPVHLSSMQMEQYCSILASNLEALSSSSRKSSLHDILTQIQKCCDHPYLVDPTLRESSRKASLIDPLDADINVSGKMQLLDKLLLEIKQCGLRAVVLFQSAVNSEKISTGHFLDDVVHQRFGENSYVYIPGGKVLSKHENAKKKESLKTFNDVESDSFICLFDYGACHSSVRLSRVDVVILFNSEGNPLNDIKALRRITIDLPCERLNVIRFYSAFTIEEKALILSKQGTTVNYMSSSICHQLLAWGASYLFSKLQSCTESGSLSFIDDVAHELSSVLRNKIVNTGPTSRLMISKAQMQNGAYARSILLFGETETHTKENSSAFWSNLVKQSQHRPKNSCSRLPRKVQKSPGSWFAGENRSDATTSSSVRTKPRSKRKVNKKVRRKGTGTNRPFDPLLFNHTDAQLPELPSTSISDSAALNPRTNEGQQSQRDQSQPHTSSSTPLEAELERVQKEREQITKWHQDKVFFSIKKYFV
ncbi:hypothetical protein L1987_84321 [Smallanthus sonchifolius]|uniref:Uncharacterized protein n=1 Tax=Smallanthus sonchifolius TaxID=185202 RepID=A0ACB8YEH3_9ASTR|nr:hypothetical protein L1987_84321 [Smallanthus sonchifolius]